ncbi:MAG: hypothetical protein ACPL8I_02700 [Chloroflexaceae bacterium]
MSRDAFAGLEETWFPHPDAVGGALIVTPASSKGAGKAGFHIVLRELFAEEADEIQFGWCIAAHNTGIVIIGVTDLRHDHKVRHYVPQQR